ncbi:hypothetical protein KL948_005095 [Ogataea haglerorum]|nr:hypothetical protein KL948_005095 [Ogataea haglerorum]
MDVDVTSAQQLPFAVGSSKNFLWCPTMDLVSFQLSKNALWVYRLGNQRVWTIELDDDQEIECLCWRPDGKIFALISTEGQANLFDSSSGKLMLKFQIGSSIETCSWFNRLSTFDTSNKYEQMFNISLTNSLPKLTSSHSSKKLVNDDQLIKCEDSSLDFLIIGSEHGMISLVLYGIFIIENFQLPQLQDSHSTFLGICSSRNLVSHYILTEKEEGLFVIKLTTSFVEIYGNLLPRVCLACSKLVGLLTYVKELIDDLASECKPFEDYTVRIVDLLKSEIESLPESKNNTVDPIYDLYDLLLTGVMTEPTRAWISDYLGDRGLKRWTKLGKQYYESSRKNLFYNLIPALEHMLVYLSDLHGLSNWKENEGKLGLQGQLIDKAIELTSKLLRLLYQNMLKLNEQQQCFESFVQWLNAILVEITSDEKSTDTIKTKEVIKFLTTGLQISINDDSSQLFSDLKHTCEQFFDAIKSNMKTKMNSDMFGRIGGVGCINAKLSIYTEDEKEFGLVIMQQEGQATVVKFDCFTLNHSIYPLEISDLLLGKTADIQGTFLNPRELVILVAFKDDMIKSDLLVLDTRDIMTGASTELSRKNIMKHTEFREGFIPRYIAINPLRRIGCLLDSNKKSYIVVEI